MQIRRFSHLFSFLPVVLIGSIALAMVAGAPASADLEQHTAESFLNLPNLEGMSLKALNELLEIKTKLYESHLNAMRRLEAYGGTAAERKAAVDILRNDAHGCHICGTVRFQKKLDQSAAQPDFSKHRDHLEAVVVDELTADDFSEAVKGVEVVIHTASPNSLEAENPEETLLKPRSKPPRTSSAPR
ncbi:hypothetical protein CF336_g8559 [Tilletia laevis]|nr:hypothetical protein CF336_g8559 [Tilletia laevis]